MNSSARTLVGYLHSLLVCQGDAASDDRELLRRFVERRDDDAFAVPMRRHGPMVLKLARRLVGDEQLAEDVFQAAFLLLARKAWTIRRAESLACWLHGAARRFALQTQRRRQRRRAREAHASVSSPSTPPEVLTAREFLAVLDEELDKLAENYRAPLILCCLEGLSQEETAKRLGCSVGAVKGRLERGRNRLRLRLEKRGLTLPAVLGGTLLLAGSTSPVPAALMQSTLQAATMGSGATPAALVLMEEAMRSMLVHKLKAIGAVVMLLAVTGAGAGMMALHPQAAQEKNPPEAASADKPMSADKRVDLYGDPLPEGAIMRLGTLQRRVVGARVAVSADGKSIISVRGGKYITFWDAATGKRRKSRELPVDIDVLYPIWALSPDGRLLATGGNKDGKQIVVWDVQTGKAIRELLLEKSGDITCCNFAPDGRRLVSIGHPGKDCCIHLWNLGDGKLLFHKVIQAAASYLVAIAPDGKHVLAEWSSRDDVLGVNVYCWEIESGRLLWRSKEFRLNPITFLPDSKLLVWRPAPRCLDFATGRPAELTLPPEILLDTNSRLVFAPDGQTLLLSKGWDVTVWDWRKGKKLHTLKGAWQAQFMPDGKSILTNNGSLQRWDLSSGKAVWPDTFELGHLNYVIATAFTSDGRRLVSGSSDGTVRLWDVKTGRPLAVWGGYERPSGLAGGPWKGFKLILTPDGDRLLCDAQDGIDLRDTRTGERLRSFSLPRRDGFAGMLPIYRVRLSPDGGKVVALAGQEYFYGAEQFLGNGIPTNELAIWDLKTGQLLLRRPISWKAKAISPDGRHVLLADGSLLDVETGKEIARMQGMAGCFADAFSSDGALIVGGFHRVPPPQDAVNLTADSVGVWEAATGKVAAHFKPKGPLGLGGFHPDSRYIVLTDSEGVKLWDLLDGKIAASCRIKGAEHWHDLDMPSIYAAPPLFARDGRRLATSLDSIILLCDMPAPRMPRQRLEAKVLETLWADLADADAAKAWRAVWRLADAPHDALAFLRGRLKPVRMAAADLTRKLLADLDSDSFEVREAAVKRLKELGLQAEPALRAALKAKPSLEQRRRIEDLLAVLSIGLSPPAPEELRQLRALIVLERIGSLEARRLLEQAAQAPPSTRLTRQARAALTCLP